MWCLGARGEGASVPAALLITAIVQRLTAVGRAVRLQVGPSISWSNIWRGTARFQGHHVEVAVMSRRAKLSPGGAYPPPRMRLALQQQTANFKLAISRRAMQRSFLTETKKIMIRRKGAWTNERKNSSGRNNARQRKTNTLRCAPASDALLRTLNHK